MGIRGIGGSKSAVLCGAARFRLRANRCARRALKPILPPSPSRDCCCCSPPRLPLYKCANPSPTEPASSSPLTRVARPVPVLGSGGLKQRSTHRPAATSPTTTPHHLLLPLAGPARTSGRLCLGAAHASDRHRACGMQTRRIRSQTLPSRPAAADRCRYHGREALFQAGTRRRALRNL